MAGVGSGKEGGERKPKEDGRPIMKGLCLYAQRAGVAGDPVATHLGRGLLCKLNEVVRAAEKLTRL